jgi:hypothetical protein
MKKNNVLQFPKEQVVRVKLRERAAHQKAVLALSILSVLMLSVLTNQWLTRPEGANASLMGNRGIASIRPLSAASDIKWEHNLAQELSKSSGMPAHLAVKPSLRDELIFGSLEGRYGMKVSNGLVESLEFINNGDEALVLKDRAAFLKTYRNVFAIEYADAGLVGVKDGFEVWNLVGSDRTIVGQAHFKLDDKERMTSLSIAR